MLHRVARPRRATLVACLLGGLGAGLLVHAPARAVAGDWGPVQVVPPADADHALALTAAMPDGTLVAVWANERASSEAGATDIRRSTRPPGGEWSAPTTLPVSDTAQLEGVVALAGGGLQVAYYSAPVNGPGRHRVVSWLADGRVGETGPSNTTDDYDLVSDAAGDVVADRLGGYERDAGFDHVAHYFDGTSWWPMPRIGADPGDVLVPGPGESVWMAGYDQARTRLVVRRWTPSSSTWTTAWSRDYPGGKRRRELVSALDLAVGGVGRVTLAFLEREVGDTGATIRAVRRKPEGPWTRALVLQRLDAEELGVLTAPVVAAAGDVAEVAWTASPGVNYAREVRLARLSPGRVERSLLATPASYPAFRDLSLDVDLRDDGDVLVTYLERRGDDASDLVGWLGPHDGLERTTLVEDAGVMRGDHAFLVPGLAGAITVTTRPRSAPQLLSRVAED